MSQPGSPPTLLSFARLFRRLVVPTPDETWSQARMGIRADLAWQPYLFLAIFYGTAISILVGSDNVDPPGEDFELTEILWAITGLGSPVLAFVSVWMIINKTGRCRYRALWMRLSSDFLAMTAMITFLYEHIAIHSEHPFEGAIVIASIVFMGLLVWRDIRFLFITELVARSLARAAAGEGK